LKHAFFPHKNVSQLETFFFAKMVVLFEHRWPPTLELKGNALSHSTRTVTTVSDGREVLRRKQIRL